MIVQSTRFGPVEVDESRVLRFPEGVLGFPRHTEYVLLQPGDEDPPSAGFFWLQSLHAPELAFVVTDPRLFVPDYSVPIKADQMRALGLQRSEDAQVFVIVNKRGSTLTGNLQGPLVINPAEKLGGQLVLSERRYSTRTVLLELDPAKTARSA